GRAGEATGPRAVLPRVARRGLERRRDVRAADAAAAGGARTSRRQRRTAPRHRRVARLPPADRPARGRTAAARAARVSQRSRSCGVPQVPPVSRRTRIPGVTGRESEILPNPADGVPPRRAARALSQRAAVRRACRDTLE